MNLLAALVGAVRGAAIIGVMLRLGMSNLLLNMSFLGIATQVKSSPGQVFFEIHRSVKANCHMRNRRCRSDTRTVIPASIFLVVVAARWCGPFNKKLKLVQQSLQGIADEQRRNLQ